MSGVVFWVTISIAGLVTFLLRWSFLALVDSLELPATIRHALRFVPVAVFSAIVWPAILIQQDAIVWPTENLRLWATVAAALVAWRTRSVPHTIVTGMAAFWLLSISW